MSVTFASSRLAGELIAPASKSQSHRQMICAGLSHGQTRLSHFMTSDDTHATALCLMSLGSSVKEEDQSLVIDGFAHKWDLLPVFPCGESGSTLRFFVPLAMAICGGGRFSLRGNLARRPMDVYRDLFVPRGASWHMSEGTDGAATLTVAGRLSAGEYVLPGNVSSQFVSGLLFALPLLPTASTLRVIPPVESAAYIDMTIQALEESGIAVEHTDTYTYRIPGLQNYQAKDSEIEGDWSQAAVYLCADALGAEVWVRGLREDSVQGDREVLSCLEKMGARVVRDHGRIRVEADTLHGVDLELSGTPDIAPILALCCQLASGESRLRGCGRLRVKECDRLAGTVEILNRLGGDAREEGDDIVIRGVSSLKGGEVSTFRDHRMIMLASMAAMVCEGPVYADDVSALSKSWPEYLDVYRRLGGQWA